MYRRCDEEEKFVKSIKIELKPNKSKKKEKKKMVKVKLRKVKVENYLTFVSIL
jgi:ABC-type uncharacterized transport system substrate-binding protein